MINNSTINNNRIHNNVIFNYKATVIIMLTLLSYCLLTHFVTHIKRQLNTKEKVANSLNLAGGMNSLQNLALVAALLDYLKASRSCNFGQNSFL